MNDKKIDRRIKRTENAIFKSLSALASQKPLTSITVTELCQMADIHKSTFYLHYHDIHHCAEEFQKRLTGRICSIIAEYEYRDLLERSGEIWGRIMEAYLSYDGIYLPFIKSNSFGAMMQDLETSIIDTIVEKYQSSCPDATEKEVMMHRINVTFLINGYVGTLRSFDFALLKDVFSTQLPKSLLHGFSTKG
ncbi:MAG: TetR/AcrR family transcriptional regulator [Lachnospiraceae bacterium]|nr:TetR/AcrR family transcriptional regulator [Lachnospiraceae bacterium]